MQAAQPNRGSIGVERPRIALFDNHARWVSTLAAMLSKSSQCDVIAIGSSSADALATAEEFLPEVMLLDLNMPGNGAACAKQLRLAFPFISTIVMTTDDTEQTAVSALISGASAVIEKGAPFKTLCSAISAVLEGEALITPRLAELLLPSGGRGTPWFSTSRWGQIPLIYREEQILSRLAQGLSNDEIGASLGLASDVVGKYLGNVLRKVHDYAGLVHA